MRVVHIFKASVSPSPADATSTKFLRTVRAMVQRNDHGSAYQLAAKTLGCVGLEEQFDRINRRCDHLGHVPIDLDHKRYGLYQQLMAYAKAHMSAAHYCEFYSSF